MMRKFLSQYSLNYPRSLIYMLQSSEYKIREYLRWYYKVKNFNYVEQRKHFVKTPKAILLLALSWFMLLSFYLVGFLNLINSDLIYKLISVIFIIIAPFILAHIIIIPLLIIKFLIQKPIEIILIKRAREKISKHPGLKIGIAGSFGKTTMREILKTVISQGKKVAAPPSSYNTPLGICKFIEELTGDEEVLIFELGEYYPGDISKLCDLVQPELGIITGVNEAHFEKFKSLRQTAKTIFELADYLGDGEVYVNGENNLAKENAKKSHKIYSRNGAGSCKIENLSTDLSGTRFSLVREGIKMNIESGLLGLHQAGPLVAAADIAFNLGIPSSKIQAGLNKTKPFDHRLEPKKDNNGIITLDDSYNGNPDGVNAVIDFLSSLKDHRRIYITPGLVEMGSRAEQIHKDIGHKLSEAGIEKVILIKNSVTPYIEMGLKESSYKGEIIWFDNAIKAFNSLPLLTIKDDVLLIQNDWPDQYQ